MTNWHHVPQTSNPGQQFVTVLNVYASTLQAETGVKVASYHNLHNLLQQVDSKDKLLILGDSTQEWEETLNCEKES